MKLVLYKKGNLSGSLRLVAFDDEVCDRVVRVIEDCFDTEYSRILSSSQVYYGGAPAVIELDVDMDYYASVDQFVEMLAEKTAEKADIVYAETQSIEF